MSEALEAALLDLEREIAYTAFVIRSQRMTDREMAIYHQGLALAAGTAEYQHKAQADRERQERIGKWRRQREEQAHS